MATLPGNVTFFNDADCNRDIIKCIMNRHKFIYLLFFLLHLLYMYYYEYT